MVFVCGREPVRIKFGFVTRPSDSSTALAGKSRGDMSPHKTELELTAIFCCICNKRLQAPVSGPQCVSKRNGAFHKPGRDAFHRVRNFIHQKIGRGGTHPYPVHWSQCMRKRGWRLSTIHSRCVWVSLDQLENVVGIYGRTGIFIDTPYAFRLIRPRMKVLP